MKRVYYLSRFLSCLREAGLRKSRSMVMIGVAPCLLFCAIASLEAAPQRGNLTGGDTAESDALHKWYNSGTTGSAAVKPLPPIQVKKAPLPESKNTSTQLDAEAHALLMLDRQQVDFKQIAEQISKNRRQVTDEPEVASLRFKLGTYLYMLGDIQAAANELKIAVHLKPNNVIYRAQLARMLELSGEHQEALGQFRKAVEQSSNIAVNHYLYAECLFHDGNISEAINQYRKAASIKQEPDAYCGLSEALLATGDTIGAMKAARQAVALEPSRSRAQVALTNALLKSGDQQSSLRTARQAALLNPNMPESHLALGRCLFTRGDIAGAVEEFRQAVLLDPLNFQAHNDLGYALYSKNDLFNAISEFRLALRLNPRFTEARNNLEVAMHRLNTDNKL